MSSERCGGSGTITNRERPTRPAGGGNPLGKPCPGCPDCDPSSSDSSELWGIHLEQGEVCVRLADHDGPCVPDPHASSGSSTGERLTVYEVPGGGWGASCCGGKHKFTSRDANEAQRTVEVLHLRDQLHATEVERDEQRKRADDLNDQCTRLFHNEAAMGRELRHLRQRLGELSDTLDQFAEWLERDCREPDKTLTTASAIRRTATYLRSTLSQEFKND